MAKGHDAMVGVANHMLLAILPGRGHVHAWVGVGATGVESLQVLGT